MSCRAPDTRGHAGCAAGSQPDALPAMPRKTTSARFSRRTLASSSAPSRAASFDRRTVVTLSTMIRLSAPSPLPSSSSTSSRNCGASVRVHERLIVLGRLTRRERPRLPVRLRGKPFRHHIRNPDLHRSQALRAQPSTVPADPAPRAHISHDRHLPAVTCNAITPSPSQDQRTDPAGAGADIETFRQTIGTAQSKIAHYPSAAKSGNATKRLRLRGDVPGYTPGDAGFLAETPARPGSQKHAARPL